MITVRRQIELESIFLIMVAAGISLFFVTYRNNYQPQFKVALVVPVAPIATEASIPKIAISSQISPDGTKKVIMKITKNPDNTSTYDFSTANGDDSGNQHVFTKILDSSASMVIPFNAWSPDNKYFFIMQNLGSSKSSTESVLDKSVFVFKATGEAFSDTEKYLDAADSFSKANTGNNFDVATGWASETLIIINTIKPDSSKGASYWFEVPSKAVIQLSTEF